MATFGQLLIDVKYANMCSFRLERWKLKSARPYLANFRCPYCGDSKKNRLKARGFLYEKDNEIRFKCHNGCDGRVLRTFLKDHHPLVLKEYILESFSESNGGSSRRRRLPEDSATEAASGILQVEERTLERGWAENCLLGLKTVRQLRADHPVRKYVDSRQLPDHAYDVLRYAPAFVKFTNSLIPNKLSAAKGDEPRLIMPFHNRSGKFVGFQGRSFGIEGLRYISIMLDPKEKKVFGMDKIDFNKTVYVLEGVIDSFFMDNAIATIQGDLTGADDLLKGRRCVYIPDKDRRNRQIVKLVEKLIARDRTVCLLPPEFPGKDLNEAIQNGMDVGKLHQVVGANTFSGLELKLHFATWKKI